MYKFFFTLIVCVIFIQLTVTNVLHEKLKSDFRMS